MNCHRHCAVVSAVESISPHWVFFSVIGDINVRVCVRNVTIAIRIYRLKKYRYLNFSAMARAIAY